MEYRVTRNDRVLADRFMNEADAEGLAETLAVRFPGGEYWVEESADGIEWAQLSQWEDRESVAV